MSYGAGAEADGVAGHRRYVLLIQPSIPAHYETGGGEWGFIVMPPLLGAKTNKYTHKNIRQGSRLQLTYQLVEFFDIDINTKFWDSGLCG